MEYQVIRSTRKTISVEVTRDLRILVRAPAQLSDENIREFVNRHRTWIQTHRERQQAKLENQIVLSEAQLALLRILAEEELPKKVRHFGLQMQLMPEQVRITAAKTRLGSCGSNRHINFSMYLMLYPEPLIDYVVVHELAHLRYLSHNSSFYSLIAQYIPDYKERLRQIRKLNLL